MSPNWDTVRAGGGGYPPDGVHAARLERAVNNEGYDKLITEWQTVTGPPYYWDSWNGWDGQQLSFTLDLLRGLGIDTQTLTDDDAFEAAADAVVGNVYEVRTESREWQGKIYVNTYVKGRAGQVQEQLDVPIDNGGLPAASMTPERVAASGDPDDDDVPF